MFTRTVVTCAALVLCASCTSTYHPEYHPVTVTTVHPSVGAPGGTLVVQQPQLADPDVVFHQQ